VTFGTLEAYMEDLAPAKCKKNIIWLEAKNQCWTADRFAKKGLPHPSRCLFCDQEQEDIQHILTTCVLTKEFWLQVWSIR
jgi:hypothetical protein